MLRKLIPVLLALIGLAGGGAAGYFLRPAPTEAESEAHATSETADSAKPAAETPKEGENGEDAVPTQEYVKLNNQFVVPVIEEGEVSSLVVLSLSLEVKPGATEKVYASEPKIRDLILQVLFEHANAGGFNGSFTNTRTMEELRQAMLNASRIPLGDLVTAVLISDIVRQDAK